MYIKTFNRDIESSPEILKEKKIIDKMSYSSHHKKFQKIHFCKSFFNRQVESPKNKLSISVDKQTPIEIAPQLFWQKESHLKNNRIREIKNRDKKKKDVKQRNKLEFVGGFKKCSQNVMSKVAIPSKDFCNTKLDGKQIKKTILLLKQKSTKYSARNKKSQTVLDFKRNNQKLNMFVDQKQYQYFLQKIDKFNRYPIKTQQKEHQKYQKRSLSSQRKRSLPISPWKQKYDPKSQNFTFQNLQPWVVNNHEEQQPTF